ncbi:ABC transporter substrate-binding protein [Frigidibacter sp. MR17.14]|uniref:ABC transporter substrate-binding protein n=1 Tax=Frigidibacter sp. MR17.14 TaxID=3126509 RepID=UPI003012ED50
MMRAIAALFFGLWASAAPAETFLFPAPGPAVAEMTVYSSFDERLAAPLIAGFQRGNPGVTIHYEDLLTAEISTRVIAETRAGGPTADFAFSSAMDLQVKLVNDGFAQPVHTAETETWPRWANWRDTGYALTFEPAVFVYNRPSFASHPPPQTRAEFLAWMRDRPDEAQGRIGTYDVEQSGVGYLFLARDEDHFRDIWRVVRAMGHAGVQAFPTSVDILERVADGRLVMGYNILGSYAADWARTHPDVGILLPKDFTVVASRIGLVPRAAAQPELGARFLAYLMSPEGQTVMTEELKLPAVSLKVAGRNSALAMGDLSGGQLRPIPVGPGLLAYLDHARRARLIAQWRAALSGR